jgi:cupin 2 domain-containing protein
MEVKNIFSSITEQVPEEIFEVLLENENLKVERIVSDGQVTADGEWYDQDTDEWVLLLKGSAGLLFEDGKEARVLKPGDYMLIPAHTRHRVEWTNPHQKTIWLALHFKPR